MRASLCVLVFCAAAPAFAQEADDDQPPGLIARYTAGDRSIERVDRDVQFVWRDGAPDQRLPAGPFAARWTGVLLIRSEGTYLFPLHLQGDAAVSIDGRQVTQGQREEPGWLPGSEVALEPGDHKLEVTFRSQGTTGQIRLFWASQSFPLEPIPGQLLFHDGPRADLAKIERGRDLFAAHRCGACHRRDNAPAQFSLAALPQAASGLSREWLAGWLRDPAAHVPHARMPSLGFTEAEVRAVAEFLVSQAQPFDEKSVAADDRAGAFRRGELLFRTVGCLACHTQGNLGTVSPFNGGDLTRVAAKRSEAWLSVWLKEPERLNSDHRMPVFKLSEGERQDLAVYLSGEKPAAPTAASQAPDQNLVTMGRKLVEEARCIQCHLGAAAPVASGLSTLDRPIADWSKACSDAGPDAKQRRPGYALSPTDREALHSYVDAHAIPLSRESSNLAAASILKQTGCLNCHERDGGRGVAAIAGKVTGLDTELTGQSEALLPPDLTAIGDKQLDAFLVKAVTGRQDAFRLPWLRVRMPRFREAAVPAASLQQFFVDHDRIPEGGPRATVSAGAPPQPVEATALRSAGRVLAGTHGHSCVACHIVGKFEPRGVAIATRGSDLFGLAKRMRPEFFARWVRAPLRIVPNMEMPSFDKPLAGVLEGRHDTQMAALWAAMNDPRGAPTLDTSTVEQFIAFEPGAPPRIIRDVFEIGEAGKPELVPRAFAVGLGNGIDVLFDADLMAMRAWWAGDLARQRASGKSWYWEPTASAVKKSTTRTPDVALRPAGNPAAPLINARFAEGRFGRLQRYMRQGDGVVLRYVLPFDLPGNQSAAVTVTERFLPAPPTADSTRVACRRQIAVTGVPAGYDVVLFDATQPAGATAPASPVAARRVADQQELELTYAAVLPGLPAATPVAALPPPRVEPITSVPGYAGVRLPLLRSMMPTGITWTKSGTLAFCSLKGQVYLARDTDGDGIEDSVTVFEEGLASPYGLIADGDDLIVAHKPELLRLRDTDGDGRADVREVLADGWGYTDDYHDWTTGIVRDSQGRLYIGTGSDYAKAGRDRAKSKWRGKVLRVDRDGTLTVLGHAFRYPTGLAITPDDQVFVSDNQGVQNTFNEINHLVAGGNYGVPSLYEEPHEGAALNPAIRLPHPWTRSVNGIFFLPASAPGPFAGHGIGCEYDTRFLVRFTLQRVGETYQGAVYPFSKLPDLETAGQFLGTLSGAAAPNGDIVIGSFLDSGWVGGNNRGDLVRLRSGGTLPCGIREIQAFDSQFVITFTSPVDRQRAARPEEYEIAGYTRVWQGAYATPDSGRHKLTVRAVEVAADGLSAVLRTDRQQEGHVYEIRCGKIGPDRDIPLWPAEGHYTMNRVPTRP